MAGSRTLYSCPRSDSESGVTRAGHGVRVGLGIARDPGPLAGSRARAEPESARQRPAAAETVTVTGVTMAAVTLPVTVTVTRAGRAS